MQNCRPAPDRLTLNLHFKKVPRGSVCVRSTDLNDTKCQAPELAFLTWFTVSASPIPASSPQRPEPLPFPPQCITWTVCFPISSIHALLKFLFPVPKTPTIHLLRSFLALWSPGTYHATVSCFVDSIHILLIKQPSERDSARNLSPIFSWMGKRSFCCFCLSTYS